MPGSLDAAPSSPDRRRQRWFLLAGCALLVLAFVPYARLGESADALLPAVFGLLATAPILAAFAQRGGLGRMAKVAVLWWGIGACWLIRLDPMLGPFAWLAMIVLGVVQTAPLGWALGRLRERYGIDGLLWAAPFAWAGWEWARSYPPAGAPWFSLGHAFWKLPVLCQLVEVTGVPGISFVVAMVGAGLARLLLGRREDRLQLAVALGLLLGLAFYGSVRLATIDVGGGRAVRVALVQPNIPFNDKRTTDPADLYTGILDQSRGVPPGTELVIWPETAAPVLLERPQWRPYVAQLARELGATVIAGCFHPIDKPMNWSPARTNAAVVFGPRGNVEAVYSKVRIVLFGEYTPGRQYPLMRRLAVLGPQFFAGYRFHAVDTAVGRLGTAICYESVFSGDCLALVRDRAEALTVMTNDDQLMEWGARQHYQQAVFRCIETRRWMARCANGGISAVIDPGGRVVTQGNWSRREIVNGTLHLRTDRSPLVRWGDWFGPACLILVLGLLAWPRRTAVS